MTPSCPHGVTGPDALREAVIGCLFGCRPDQVSRPYLTTYLRIADDIIAAVRAYDAAHVAAPVAVPAGGRDLAEDVDDAAFRYDADGALMTRAAYIADELTRLGWTCAGSGTGAPLPVPHHLPEPIELAFRNDPIVHACLTAHRFDYVRALEECIPHILRDRDTFRDMVIKQKMMATTHTFIAAPVALACGISEGARGTLGLALTALENDAFRRCSAHHISVDTRETVMRAAQLARAELDGLPVLGVGK